MNIVMGAIIVAIVSIIIIIPLYLIDKLKSKKRLEKQRQNWTGEEKYNFPNGKVPVLFGIRWGIAIFGGIAVMAIILACGGSDRHAMWAGTVVILGLGVIIGDRYKKFKKKP